MSGRLPTDTPVLVVGSGPTGLLVANLLGTYGIETLLVERNATTSSLPKAILLDDEGLRALQAVGLADEVLGHVIAGYGARYYAPDGECFAEVDAPVTGNGFHRRNAFLQPQLERIMLRGLDRFDVVTCAFETALTGVDRHDGHVDVVLRTRTGEETTVRCGFVLACDGGRSTVRELLGIAMTGRTDSRDWVVVDTLNDPDRDRFSKFFCDPARPMVSIPAPGGGRRYEYMVMPGEDAAAMATPERIAAVLARFRPLAPADMLRGVVYTFHARVADRLSRGRIGLLGDAAHLSPPFAGQGMNAGLRDAFNVAWKVALATRGVAASTILDSYEIERRGPIIELIDYAVALGAIVMSTGEFDRDATAAALAGESMTADGLAIRPRPQAAYRTGWMVPGGEAVGRPLPQPKVRRADGGVVRLDNVLGPEFAIVGVDVASDAVRAMADNSLGACRVLVATKAASPDAATLVGDPRGLGDLSGQIVLVRPDRFVAAQCDGTRPAGLEAQLRQLLKSAAAVHP